MYGLHEVQLLQLPPELNKHFGAVLRLEHVSQEFDILRIGNIAKGHLLGFPSPVCN